MPGGGFAAFNSAVEPQNEQHPVRRYRTRSAPSWHYEAVNALLDGAFLPA